MLASGSRNVVYTREVHTLSGHSGDLMGSEAPEFWLVALALGLLSVWVPQRYPHHASFIYSSRFVSTRKNFGISLVRDAVT